VERATGYSPRNAIWIYDSVGISQDQYVSTDVLFYATKDAISVGELQ
jgi:hypothetical protein